MSGKRVNVGIEGETPKVYFSRKSMKKRVDVGEEGATPKKIISTNSKKVNLGIEGMTPKKVVNADGTTKAFHFSKRVNVGDEGHTPIKTFQYFSNIPIAAAPNKAQFTQSASAISKHSKLSTIHEFLPPPPPENHSRERSSSAESSVKIYPEEKSTDLPSPSGRPKTSRGKSHPSPDEFFDYVVPSPPPGKNKSSKQAAVIGLDHRFSGDDHDSDDDIAAAHIIPPATQAHHVKAVDSWRNEEGDDDNDNNNDEYGDEYGEGVDGTDESAGGFEDGEPQVEAEEEIYDVSGADAEGASEESWEAQQLRHIHMGGANEHRNKQVRMLGCWLFGSALRI